jgi:hypothetical protein
VYINIWLAIKMNFSENNIGDKCIVASEDVDDDNSVASEDVDDDNSVASEDVDDDNSVASKDTHDNCEVKERKCIYRNHAKFGLAEEKDPNPFVDEGRRRHIHSYIDRTYRCEDCGNETCREHTMTDSFEERVNDGVFLCRYCYHCNQNFMDVM